MPALSGPPENEYCRHLSWEQLRGKLYASTAMASVGCAGLLLLPLGVRAQPTNAAPVREVYVLATDLVRGL